MHFFTKPFTETSHSPHVVAWIRASAAGRQEKIMKSASEWEWVNLLCVRTSEKILSLCPSGFNLRETCECSGNRRSRQCLDRPPSDTEGWTPLRGSFVRSLVSSGKSSCQVVFLFFSCIFFFAFLLPRWNKYNSLDTRENGSVWVAINNIEYAETFVWYRV